MSGEKRERWRKEWVRGNSGTPSPATAPLAAHPTHLLAAHLLHPSTPQGSPHLPPVHLEGALAADVSLTVLHTLETIVQVMIIIIVDIETVRVASVVSSYTD